MKCFTVTQSGVRVGMAVVAEPYPHVGVGEEGRGRKYVRFPVGQRLAQVLARYSPCRLRGEKMFNERDKCHNCGIVLEKRDEGIFHPDDGNIVRYNDVERASILKTHQKGTLLLVEERNPSDRRAIVLADVEGGFRGSSFWTAVEFETKPCPERGKINYAYTCDLCGEPYPAKHHENGLSFSDKNIHPDKGIIQVYAPFPPAGITVLAEGYRAEGAAGRAGGPHLARLLIMEPGSTFRIRRYGRLYGGPKELFVAWDGEELRLGTEDEIFPPVEEEGVLL